MAVCIALVIGPTPGHVYPALALADAIREQDATARIVMIGPQGDAVRELVDGVPYDFYSVPAAPLARCGWVGWINLLVKLLPGWRAARAILRREHVDIVLSFGAYASGAVLLAARSLHLPTAVHEGNVVPGLANQLLASSAQRIYLGSDIPSWARASRESALVLGTPVRADVAALFGLQRGRPVGRPIRVLVLAGASGAGFLASSVPMVLVQLQQAGLGLEVWHQAGSKYFAEAGQAYAAADIPVRLDRYIKSMDEAYRWADFVIARSGAGTISELAIAGVPALLVPWVEAAHDHQTFNARAFANAGAGIWVSEQDWSSDKLAPIIARLLGDETAWRSTHEALRRMARPDAGRQMASDLLSLSGSSSSNASG